MCASFLSRFPRKKSNRPESTTSSSTSSLISSFPFLQRQPTLDFTDGHEQLEELDELLEQLAEIYPAHTINECRQRLLSAPVESRLAAAAYALADEPQDTALYRGPLQKLEPWERFRSSEYQRAVYKLLVSEFAKLSKSSIRAVLAENNFDYSRSRALLHGIQTRSWRVTVLNFFSWGSSRKSSNEDFKNTGCLELDEEIDALTHAQDRKRRFEEDERLAQALNEEQYKEEDSLFECECCYGDYAWEEIAFCPSGHYFCRSCLKRSVQESLFGQGSGIEVSQGSFHCISSSSSCESTISSQALSHFLPSDVHASLEHYLAKSSLEKSGIEILRCPFCPYAVEDFSPPSYRQRGLGNFVTCVWIYAGVLHWFGTGVKKIIALIVIGLFSLMALGYLTPEAVRRELDRLSREKTRSSWDTIFRCQNPTCLRGSCLKCGKEWIGIHQCTDEGDSKQAYVARRMDEALKRTCPRCNTSFLKNGGCNKMTCTCGYKMCYLCRADVCEEQYAHFCQHFRAIVGQPCAECTKCLLFQDEKEDDLLYAVQKEAEMEWEDRRRADGKDGPTVLILEDRIPGARLKGWNSLIFDICASFGL